LRSRSVRGPRARIFQVALLTLDHQEAQTKLDRYFDAIEKGMVPALYVERLRAAQAEMAAAGAVIKTHGSAAACSSARTSCATFSAESAASWGCSKTLMSMRDGSSTSSLGSTSPISAWAGGKR
jgi:hypothetical protein